MSYKGISERELEDYVCANLGDVFNSTDIELIGRQLGLPHGILDVLAVTGRGHIILAELKARPLFPKDIIQIFRYASDLGDILRTFAYRDLPVDTLVRWPDALVDMFCMGQGPTSICPIRPVLIGAGLGDDSLDYILQGARCEAVLWDVDEDGILQFAEWLPFGMVAMPTLPKWATRLVNKLAIAADNKERLSNAIKTYD